CRSIPMWRSSQLVYSAATDQSKSRVPGGRRFARYGARIGLVQQFSVDLGADRGFDDRVVDIAEHTRFRAQLDALGRFDVALDDAVEHDAGNHDRALDAAVLADRENCARSAAGTHVA